MVQLRIGERVVIRAQTLMVRGLSPMGTHPRRIQLENLATGEQVEVPLTDLQSESNDVEEDRTRE